MSAHGKPETYKSGCRCERCVKGMAAKIKKDAKR